MVKFLESFRQGLCLLYYSAKYLTGIDSLARDVSEINFDETVHTFYSL